MADALTQFLMSLVDIKEPPRRTPEIIQETSRLKPEHQSVGGLEDQYGEKVSIWDIEEGDEELPYDDVLELARTIYGEARGEGEEGMNAVAHVIKNRVKSGKYGQGVKGVTRKPWQFSAWNKKDPNREKILGLRPGEDDIFDEAIKVAENVLGGKTEDPTQGALHYYNPDVVNARWDRNKKAKKIKIGNHLFVVGVK